MCLECCCQEMCECLCMSLLCTAVCNVLCCCCPHDKNQRKRDKNYDEIGEDYYVGDTQKMAIKGKKNKNKHGNYLPPAGGPGYGGPQGMYGMPNQGYGGPQDPNMYQNMGGNGMAWPTAPQQQMQGYGQPIGGYPPNMQQQGYGGQGY